jgi:hypothetical protein
MLDPELFSPFILGVDLLSGWAEQDDVISLFWAARHFHARRADRHAGNGETRSHGTLRQKAPDG